MQKQEALERLCALLAEVNDHFGQNYTNDCLCGKNKLGDKNPQVSNVCLSFVERTVREAIKTSELEYHNRSASTPHTQHTR